MRIEAYKKIRKGAFQKVVFLPSEINIRKADIKNVSDLVKDVFTVEFMDPKKFGAESLTFAKKPGKGGGVTADLYLDKLPGLTRADNASASEIPAKARGIVNSYLLGLKNG